MAYKLEIVYMDNCNITHSEMHDISDSDASCDLKVVAKNILSSADVKYISSADLIEFDASDCVQLTAEELRAEYINLIMS